MLINLKSSYLKKNFFIKIKKLNNSTLPIIINKIIELIVISIAREELVKEISCPKTSIGINVFISNCDKGLANYISN